MLRPYRDVLALPGARAFSFAGALARLPISMVGIGIVLLVQTGRDSYTLGGQVAATFALVSAAAAPQLARLVDRFGQRRVLEPALAVNAAGMLALVLGVLAQAPTWVLFAAAAASGAAQVSVGALVRARWTALLGPRPGLHAAFSLESVVDEAVFVAGPIIIALLAVAVAPAAGLATATAAALAGGIWLTRQRGTEPVAAPLAAELPGPGPAANRGLIALTVTFACLGTVFGSAELTTVAFAAERGVPAAAGYVLACFAAGSMVSGLLYGSGQWGGSGAETRFRWSVTGLAAALLALPLADSTPALAALLCVAGIGISPTIISGNALVQALVPAQRLTEGLTWLSTAIGVGIAAGAALAGPVVDAYGSRTALLVTSAAAVAAAASAAAGSAWLRPAPAAPAALLSGAVAEPGLAPVVSPPPAGPSARP